MNNIFARKKFFQSLVTVFLCVVFTSLLFGFFNNALAQVEITEIMYDLEVGKDNDREWVELYNNGTEPIDISGWRLFEADTNHKLKVIFGNESLAGGGYAVIASDDTQFSSDWPSFSGSIFDSSSFSLSNKGEVLIIRDSELNDIDSVSYLSEWGGAGDGNSLQKIDGSWRASAPTPGMLNTAGDSPVVEDSTISDNTTNDNQEPYTAYSETMTEWTVTPKITAYAGERKRIVITGVAVSFTGAACVADNKPLSYPRYIWSFGDGARGEGENIKHTYYHPGKYIVILKVVSGNDTAMDRILVDVTDADITITNVSFSHPSFIEIKNNSPRELDLSQWQLKVGQQVFVFPMNTVILPNNKLSFPSQFTKLLAKKGDKISLLYPNNKIATSFNNTEDSTQNTTSISTAINKNTHLGVQPPSGQPSNPTSSAGVVKNIHNNKLSSSSSVSATANDSVVLGYKNTVQNIEEDQSNTSNLVQAQMAVYPSNNLGTTNQQQNTKKDAGLFWGLLGVSFLSLIAIYAVLESSSAKGEPNNTSNIQNEASAYKIIEIED